MIDRMDGEYRPVYEELAEYVGNPVFGRLCTEVQTRYGGKEEIQFSRCSMEPGWNIKFKKSGKALCTIYPRENYFTVMVVIGKKEKEAAEKLLPDCCDEIKDIYRNTKEGNGQRWLMVDLENQGRLYEDVLCLIGLRSGKKEH